MNLGDNFGIKYPTADVQFCFGIVLSHLGYNNLAKAMIEYETQQSYGIHNVVLTHQEAATRLQVSRDKIDHEIAKLAESENLSREFATVKWLYTTQILKVNTGNKLHAETTVQSVEDFLGSSKLDQVYAEVMTLLITYPHNKLLVPYIATSLFDKPFSVTLRRAVSSAWAGKVAMNSLNFSPEALSLLKDDFQKIYERGLTTSSEPFEPITGSPNAALCGDPIRCWYIYNTKSQLMSVLCGSGQEMELDGGSVSRLNLHETNDEIDMNSIDFIDVCTKIYNASSLIFEHTGLLVYDIFSHHCDHMSLERGKAFEKQCGAIYSGIKFEIVTSSIGNCSNGTHKGKIIDRAKYADYLDDRFSRSVTMKDLNNIRENLYEVTRDISPNDGHRLFEVDDHAVYLPQSAGQRFNIMMSGYKALYELIDYINRNEERTGITVDDFPVDIFRDPSYLTRFKTFDEYVKGHKIVKQLLNEIKFSPDLTRRDTRVDGFYQNEDVDRILTSKDSIKYIKEFKALGERPISILYGITHRTATMGPADRVAEDVVKLLKIPHEEHWGRYYPSIKNIPKVVNETFDTIGYYECLDFIRFFANDFYQHMDEGTDEAQYMSVNSFTAAIQFLYLLERVQGIEDCPISNEEGFFTFTIEGMTSGISKKLHEVTDTLYDFDKKRDQLPPGITIQQIYPQYDNFKGACVLLPHSAVLRILGLCFCYNLFFGAKFSKSNLGTITEDDIHAVYYTYSLLKQYMDTVYTVIFKLYETANRTSDDIGRAKAQAKNIINDIFNVAIDIVDCFSYMSIGTHVTSKFDLNCLYASDMNVYMDCGLQDAENLSTFNAAAKATREKSNMSLVAFNRMLETFSDSVGFLNDICKNLKIILSSAAKDTSSVPTGLLRTMELLDKEIMSDSYIEDDKYKQAAALLSVHATFNVYGFAIKDGNLVCQDAGIFMRYYHRSGVVCLINKDFASIQHSEFSKVDYDFIASI